MFHVSPAAAAGERVVRQQRAITVGKQYSLDDDEGADDDEGRGAPARRRRREAAPSGPRLATVLAVVSIAAWGCLLLAVGCGGLLFCSSLGKATSAPQEAALGAVFSTVFIGLYIFVRCVEKVLASLERLRPKPTESPSDRA